MDASAIEIGAGAAGLVSASAVIMVLLQRVKDYFPSIEGRGAMLACDVVSFMVAFAAIYQTTPDWAEGLTYIALAMLTLSFGITARALFSQMFHVAVAGSPPSSEATVEPEDVNDPNVEEPTPEWKPRTDGDKQYMVVERNRERKMTAAERAVMDRRAATAIPTVSKGPLDILDDPYDAHNVADDPIAPRVSKRIKWQETTSDD